MILLWYDILHYLRSVDYLRFVMTSNFLKNPQPGNDMAFHRIFSFYGNLYIPKCKYWELHGFSLTLNLWGSAESEESLHFLILSLNIKLHSFHGLEIVCISTWSKIFKKPPNFGMFVSPHALPVLWKFIFFIFPRISWISTSPKIFKKPKTLKCLCFPMLFPYYGNSILGNWYISVYPK